MCEELIDFRLFAIILHCVSFRQILVFRYKNQTTVCTFFEL